MDKNHNVEPIWLDEIQLEECLPSVFLVPPAALHKPGIKAHLGKVISNYLGSSRPAWDTGAPASSF